MKNNIANSLVNQCSVLLTNALMLAKFDQMFKPRLDWHEPDEQGISAEVKGNHLDNAMGDEYQVLYHDPQTGADCAEQVVILKVNDKQELSINLATLLALATVGAKTLVQASRGNL